MENFPQLLQNKDLDRLRRYQENLDFYKGSQWNAAYRRERRLTFNYAKVFIDKMVSYLMTGIVPTVDPADDSPEEKERARKAEVALRSVYEQNSLDLLDFETEIDCAVLGDAVYKVIWDSEEKRVRVTAPDAQGVYCWWRGDDVASVYRIASRYALSRDEVQQLYDFVPANQTSTVVEDWTKDYFSLYIDNAPHLSARNPYGFIPFVIFPNLREPKRFWGISDLPQIIEPQRELNRALTQLSRILELSGNPIAVLENIEESEDIAVQPGAVWNVPEGAKAYLLDLLKGGGARLHIDYINLIYRTIHDISESPRAAFGGTERDLSGVALQVELQSLIQKVQRKRLIRAVAYRKRDNMILRILEQKTNHDFAGLSARIVWSAILPQDHTRLVQSERELIEAGVHSRRSAMTELGVSDPEREFEHWLEEERRLKEAEK